MRISDWSSDVCSSDLDLDPTVDDGQDFLSFEHQCAVGQLERQACFVRRFEQTRAQNAVNRDCRADDMMRQDRKSVVKGKSVSVRVDLGGRRIIKKKKKTKEE